MSRVFPFWGFGCNGSRLNMGEIVGEGCCHSLELISGFKSAMRIRRRSYQKMVIPRLTLTGGSCYLTVHNVVVV